MEPQEHPPTHTRAEQSRINGAKSRGPKSAAGKARSSKNALVHGLTAQQVLINGEDPAHLHRLRASFLAAFQPADDVELTTVELMVAARWRQFRAMGMEAAFYNFSTSRADLAAALADPNTAPAERAAIAWHETVPRIPHPPQPPPL